MKEKLEITQSMIHLFEKCGQAFRFRYLDGLVIQPQAALTVGRSVDEAVTANLIQKIDSGTDLPEEQVVDTAVTIFDREAPQTNWQDEDPGPLKDATVLMVKAHHSVIAPGIQPAAVQKKIQSDLGEYLLGGTLDIVQKDGVIADTKTSKNAYDENAIGMNLQPAMYSLLYERETGTAPKGFRYDVLIKPTVRLGVRTQQVEGRVTSGQTDLTILRADALANAVKSGNFHYASEMGWWCSEKWCGYWNLCPKGGKR